MLNGMNQISGNAKLQRVTKLLNDLSSDQTSPSMSSQDRETALEELKVHGRDPKHADPIFTREAIEVLSQIAYHDVSKTTSLNALRCLANAMLLRPATRQFFVDLGYHCNACMRLQSDNFDDMFLNSRILFLLTYETDIDFESLVDQYKLEQSIKANLQRLSATQQQKAFSPGTIEEMALIENLKLLFNFTNFCPQRSDRFLPAIPAIVDMLCRSLVSTKPPMASSIAPLVNSLINLPIDDNEDLQCALFPSDNVTYFAALLVGLLEAYLMTKTDDDIEVQTPPLIIVMRKIYEVAPKAVKLYLQSRVLPSDEDRNEVLGQTTTLPSRLLKLSTSPTAPQAREAVSSFLFELSDKDARTFVQNIGYGYASGFLFSHSLPLPDDALDSGSDPQQMSSGPSQPNNPVTGQRLEAEKPYMGSAMTKDEKEREAEKLMVLFERLKANGIIDVENPVAKAQAEGRFEELASDEDSD